MDSSTPTLADYLPELTDCPESLLDTSIIDCFERYLADSGIDPYPAQAEGFLTISAGDHLILSTPTGSGKSLVAIFAHWWAMTHDQVSFYTAPIKALVNEKFFALCEVFGSDNVGMMTGDATVNPSAPIICATAEILANKALREGEKCAVGLVIMDEFHFVADPDRGWAWQIPLIELPHTQFVLLSATLGDTTLWKDGLYERSGRVVTEVTDAKRPVPLTYRYSRSPLNETVLSLVHEGLGSLYIVFFTQRDAIDYANQLKATALISKEQRARMSEALRGFRFSTSFGIFLRTLLLHGVGVHHAGMLPKYRRLVERLAQQGLLTVICGTDTLGVGINVPIHTVIFSGLAKFDGHRQRIVKIREFQQIAGRAGRAGFDTEGLVIVQAPVEEIDALRATRKGQKQKKKKKEPGVVSWNEKTFEKLTSSPAETLVPRMQMTASMLLQLIERPGSLFSAVQHLITHSYVSRAQQRSLALEAFALFRGLEKSGVVTRQDEPFADGRWVHIRGDLPHELALNQPLSPFALAYLSVLDMDSPDYPLQVLSTVEAILEDPSPVLYAQQKKLRHARAQLLREDGVSYQEMMAELDEITWPQPLAEELSVALESYRKEHPWAHQWDLSPKSVVREMVENGMTFGDLIATYSISRAEGTVLRYLTDCYNTLRRLLPRDALTDELHDILDWLRALVEQIDNSLLAEWEALKAGRVPTEEERNATTPPPLLSENRYLFERLIRTVMFRHVSLLALDDTKTLAQLDERISQEYPDWYQATEDYWAEYDDIVTDSDARSARFITITPPPDGTTWDVRQTICDPEENHSWVIDAVVDSALSNERGEVYFRSLDVKDLTRS